MTALGSLSQVVNRLTGGNSGTPEHASYIKNGRTLAYTAGRMIDLWTEGGSPGAPSWSSSAAIPTNSTAGALQFTNPGGGRQKWITGIDMAIGNTHGVLVLYDRIAHGGNMSGTVTTAQNFQSDPASPALTRYTAGTGNQIWIYINTQIGATARTVTASYKNTASTTHTTTAVSIGGTGLREVGRLIPLPLAAGDTGVKSVISVTLSASTGTAGQFGVIIAHPLAVFPITLTGGSFHDLASNGLGPVEAVTNACLGMAWVSEVDGNSDVFNGVVHMVEA